MVRGKTTSMISRSGYGSARRAARPGTPAVTLSLSIHAVARMRDAGLPRSSASMAQRVCGGSDG
eukprot:COSAG02_NODE_35565_length_466_cov_1.122616_1_plen_63_part_10